MYTKKEMENDDIELSIAIPFFNEEENVRVVTEDMINTLHTNGIDYELVLVNNGSRDRTGEIIEEFSKQNSRIRPVHLIANAGYGGGIITGLYYCTGRYLGYTWGDNQIKADDMVSVYQLVKEKKLDWGKGYRTQRFYGLQRKIISRIYNALFKVFFNAPTPDINGVPKIFSRECYEDMDISSTNWFIDAEIMLKSIDKPYAFGEVPVIYHSREGGSSNVNFLTMVEFIVNMIQHKLDYRRRIKRNMVVLFLKENHMYEIFTIYSKLGLVQGLYTLLRLIMVPFSKIEKLIPKEGRILDLGCGNGLFANYMNLTSDKRTIVGIDLNKNRVQAAQETLNGNSQMEFDFGDVNDVNLDDIQIMTLIDLLHHMPYHEQEKLLNSIYDNLNDGGIVIVKDLKKDPSWKYIVHYIQDTISYKGSRLYFRSQEDMTAMLRKIGFIVEKHDIDDGSIYPHVVYRCEKSV